MPDALLDAVVAKGYRTTPFRRLHRQLQQRIAVAPLLIVIQLTNCPFIAGQLYIAAVKMPGNPHQRVHPVYHNRQPKQRLQQEISAANMAALVEQHPLPLVVLQAKGQIDFGLHNAKDKGRSDMLTEINPFSVRHRLPQLPPQPQPAYDGVSA